MFDLTLQVGIGHSVSLFELAFAGLIVGIIAGMFGVGGGFVLTPLLMHVFGIPTPVAVGSAICQTCGTSIASFVKYRKLKRGDPRMDVVMMGGSLVGIDAGTRLLAYLANTRPVSVLGKAIPLSQLVIDVSFIVLLSVMAFWMIIEVWNLRGKPLRGDVTIPGVLVTKVRIPPYIDLPGVALTGVSVPMMVYLGFILGLASGVMGIGGGVILTPILMYGFGLSARNAAGSGILLLFVTVALGTFLHAQQGFVFLPLAMAILVGSSIGSQIGALITQRLANRVLRLLFAVLLLLTVALIISYMLW
ncbi:MAG: sulfite exporter TauE/SafE family protein, partial [Armatimonadota bacterium]